MMKLVRRELAKGVSLTAIQTTKFKTCLLGITFLEPLSAKTAAENALLPSVLRRGTRKHPDMASVSAALDELYGGSIEPMVRKKGEIQCVGFAGSFLDDAFVPEELSILEDAWGLMAELLLEPAGPTGSFSQEYLESEKTNLKNRMRARINDKQQYAMYRLTKEMFTREAYGVDKLGEEADVDAVTGERLWERYEALLAGSPIGLYYCGSAPAQRVEAALEQALSALLRKNRSFLSDAAVSGIQVPEAPRYFGDRMDVTQGKLAMGLRLDGPCLTPERLAPLLVFNAVYGGSTNSKLFLNVREKLSLCYYANSMAEKHKGVLLISSGIAFDNYEKARDEILAQLDDCRKGIVTGEELGSARRYIVNTLRTSLDAQGRLEDFWLGQAVAGLTDTPEDISKAVEQVGLEEIKALAQSLRLDSIYFLQGKEG